MEYFTTTVDRIIFNFTAKCNLPCRFCYIPFDNSRVDIALSRDVIAKCKKFKPRIIVFGGGDPFLYQGFRDLLRFTHDGNTFIHVDTNALALHPRDVPLIKECTNQIGLPLDGSKISHNGIRHNPKHFDVVLKWMELLLAENKRIKINTVVNKANRHEIPKLANILQQYPISQWCLYQFWPLASGYQNRAEFGISYQEFLDAVLPVKQAFTFTDIDISSVAERIGSHFFVSHSGLVYTEGIDNISEYTRLGSIFESDIVEKWQRCNDQAKMITRASRRISAKES